jgi:hypothetical protein
MFMNYLDWVSHKKQEKQAKKFLNPKDERKQALTPKTEVAELPKSSVPEEPVTIGDQPRRVGDMEVRVVDAVMGIFDQAPTEERLAITLRIANHSKRRMKYRPWSDPVNKAQVRDGTPSANRYALIGTGGQSERDIEPGAVTEDILVFPRIPPLYDAELVLPLGVGIDRFRFSLPVGFVRRTQ